MTITLDELRQGLPEREATARAQEEAERNERDKLEDIAGDGCLNGGKGIHHPIDKATD